MGRYTSLIHKYEDPSPRQSADGKGVDNYKYVKINNIYNDIDDNTVAPEVPPDTRLRPTTLTTLSQPAETEVSSDLGLVARWPREFGYISIHDPTTGEWHDLPTKDAPDWAKREAFKRKELYKHNGVRRMLSAREMEKVWEEEQQAMWEHPAMTGRGIVYEDYLDNDHAKEGGA